MKRFAVLLLTLALAVCCTLPAFAADTIEVNEDVSVSGDYDWHDAAKQCSIIGK